MGTEHNNIYLTPESREVFDQLMAKENLNGEDAGVSKANTRRDAIFAYGFILQKAMTRDYPAQLVLGGQL